MSPLFSPSSQGQALSSEKGCDQGNCPSGNCVEHTFMVPGLSPLFFVGRLWVQRLRHEASLLFLGRLRLPKDRPNTERSRRIANRVKATTLPRKCRLFTGNSL